MFRWSHALLVAAAPLLLAAGYQAVPVSNVIMPAEPALDKRAELTLAPGGAIFEQAVFAPPGAILTQPLTITIAGVAGDFAAGTPLQSMTLAGKASAGIASAAGIYCVRPNDVPSDVEITAKAIIGAAAFGILSPLQRTGIDNRFCFIDKDGDSRVETAVLAGAKRKSDLVPLEITPTPVTKTGHTRLQDPSRIALRYIGPVGTSRTARFEVELHENGRKRAIADHRRQVTFGALPVSLDFFGTHFTVTGFDPAAKTLTVRAEKGFASGPFHFEAPQQTQYIYVYIPALK